MKKITAIAAALCIALSLAACGDSESSSAKDTSSVTESKAEVTDKDSSEEPQVTDESSEAPEAGTRLQELADKLCEDYPELLTGSALYGSPVFEKNCKKLFACDITALNDGMIVFNNGGGLADEVSVVIPADGNPEGQLKMLEARKDIRYADFNGYVPEELPKIDAGRVFTVGDAAVLIISDNADEIEKTVKEMLK